MSTHNHVLQSLQVGKVMLKNRIVFGPHSNNLWVDRRADAETVAYYEERARGGVGAMVIGASSVDADADYFPNSQPAMWEDATVPGLARVADAAHEHGAALFIQLAHPGIQQNPDGDRLHHVIVSPSQIPAGGTPWHVPHALRVNEIPAIVAKFADAAERAASAGLDGVEVHCAHGYLISQFLTPVENKRTDEYGGSLDNRFRLAQEVLTAVRQRVGSDFVIGVRMSSMDQFPGGLGLADYAEIAQRFEGTGLVDYINVSTGLGRARGMISPSHFAGVPSGYQAEWTGTIKKALHATPVFQVGRIDTPQLAEDLVASGRADGVMLVRELMADPYFVKKIEDGQSEDVRPCVYWNQGCLGRNATGKRLECSLNAATGNEQFFGVETLKLSAIRKQILVVGGGPAGLELARVAAKRGHTVQLHEASDRLGGQLNRMIELPGRQEVGLWRDWLVRQVEQAGVQVHLNSRLAVRDVEDMRARSRVDAVVVATGALPAHDGRSGLTTEPINGADLPHVLTYEDVLVGRAGVGDRVLIVDEQGERTAPGLAQLLAEGGAEVEIVTRWPSLGHHWLAQFNELSDVHKTLDLLNVSVTPNAWVDTIAPGETSIYHVHSGRTWSRTVDTVILVTMKYSQDELYEGLRQSGDDGSVHCIGDALAPRWVSEAVQEATRLAYAL